MKALFVSVFLYIPLSLVFARFVSRRQDRKFLFWVVILVWLLMGALVVGINDLWEIIEVGNDDEGYFFYSNVSINSFQEAMNIGRFSDYDQPGYVWMLSLVNLLTPQDWVAFKFSNLFIFTLIGLIWYRLATLLESGLLFARYVLIGVLMLTPLWFYFLFLLKDLTIVLLQSLFLLGLCLQWRKPSLRSYGLIMGAITGLLVFRVTLVLQDAVIVALVALLKLVGKGSVRLRVFSAVMVLLLGGSAYIISRNPDTIAALGMDESRAIGSSGMIELVKAQQELYQVNLAVFPLLYLLGETSGLNPKSWEEINPIWLRGLLQLPWIAFVIPFFLLGVIWLLKKSPREASHTESWLALPVDSKLVTTPWGVVGIFVVVSFFVSWKIGGTTRWRISDMPPILALAMAGWMFGVERYRWWILICWITGAGALFSFYYVLRA